MRGNRIGRRTIKGYTRSIPACAGEPVNPRRWTIAAGVYPRVCGGTRVSNRVPQLLQGLSPRVRGNRQRLAPSHSVGGSIPACAGEPRGRRLGQREPEVYPRVCGGTSCGQPRRHIWRRSIPACAGEPQGCTPGKRQERVYPRVCGGTFAGCVHPVGAEGLSPRVRGNRARKVQNRLRWRSIPACAGEPGIPTGPFHTGMVYPRVCGGTVDDLSVKLPADGLSPRVRGNRRGASVVDIYPRSIPACAGEPQSLGVGWAASGVYPRVCGGTRSRRNREKDTGGLSPRVRGNRPHPGSVLRRPGSIPACAGEPHTQPTHYHALAVYPRVCGGTGCDALGGQRHRGLSPRVRGNRSCPAERVPAKRSIPACAGEPRATGPASLTLMVYPRVCGGTPLRRTGGLVERGSIPACAGEPPSVVSCRNPCRVYPRVCGGTDLQLLPQLPGPGLSPRVRGNPGGRPGASVGWRSIPACAGEPFGFIVISFRLAVYPRVCGGT